MVDWLELHLKFGSVCISQVDRIHGYHVPETQDHILKDCPSFTDHTQQIDMNEIMNPQRNMKKPEAIIISNIYKKINDGP